MGARPRFQIRSDPISAQVQHTSKVHWNMLRLIWILKTTTWLLRTSLEFRAAKQDGIQPVADFVRHSYSERRDIIYTSVDLASLNHAGIEKLRQTFSLYDAKIMNLYRELTMRINSAYNHHVRRAASMLPLLEVLQNATQHNCFTTELMKGSFGKVLGLDSIIVLDYYGMMAARND